MADTNTPNTTDSEPPKAESKGVGVIEVASGAAGALAGGTASARFLGKKLNKDAIYELYNVLNETDMQFTTNPPSDLFKEGHTVRSIASWTSKHITPEERAASKALAEAVGRVESLAGIFKRPFNIGGRNGAIAAGIAVAGAAFAAEGAHLMRRSPQKPDTFAEGIKARDATAQTSETGRG